MRKGKCTTKSLSSGKELFVRLDNEIVSILYTVYFKIFLQLGFVERRARHLVGLRLQQQYSASLLLRIQRSPALGRLLGSYSVGSRPGRPQSNGLSGAESIDKIRWWSPDFDAAHRPTVSWLIAANNEVVTKIFFYRWDFPNGWPPLQNMMVVGLENTGDPRAKALAFHLAQKWLINNYNAYQESTPNAMFEKVRR